MEKTEKELEELRKILEKLEATQLDLNELRERIEKLSQGK